MTQILTFGACQEGRWAGSEGPQALGPGFTTQGPHGQSSTKFSAEERSIRPSAADTAARTCKAFTAARGRPDPPPSQRGLLSP